MDSARPAPSRITHVRPVHAPDKLGKHQLERNLLQQQLLLLHDVATLRPEPAAPVGPFALESFSQPMARPSQPRRESLDAWDRLDALDRDQFHDADYRWVRAALPILDGDGEFCVAHRPARWRPSLCRGQPGQCRCVPRGAGATLLRHVSPRGVELSPRRDNPPCGGASPGSATSTARAALAALAATAQNTTRATPTFPYSHAAAALALADPPCGARQRSELRASAWAHALLVRDWLTILPPGRGPLRRLGRLRDGGPFGDVRLHAARAARVPAAATAAADWMHLASRPQLLLGGPNRRRLVRHRRMHRRRLARLQPERDVRGRLVPTDCPGMHELGRLKLSAARKRRRRKLPLRRVHAPIGKQLRPERADPRRMPQPRARWLHRPDRNQLLPRRAARRWFLPPGWLHRLDAQQLQSECQRGRRPLRARLPGLHQPESAKLPTPLHGRRWLVLGAGLYGPRRG